MTSAIRYPGTATSGTPQRSDGYTYDTASNRLSQAVALNGGAPTPRRVQKPDPRAFKLYLGSSRR